MSSRTDFPPKVHDEIMNKPWNIACACGCGARGTDAHHFLGRHEQLKRFPLYMSRWCGIPTCNASNVNERLVVRKPDGTVKSFGKPFDVVGLKCREPLVFMSYLEARRIAGRLGPEDKPEDVRAEYFARRIRMKVYRGLASGRRVDVDGEDLNVRQDLAEYSADGVSWGYLGSGPAKLALAIVADCTGNDERTLATYIEFKRRVIGLLPMDQDFALTSDEVEAHLAEIEADQKELNTVKEKA